MAKETATNGTEGQATERRRSPWYLLPWILLVFLILFCCGQVALLTSLPAEGGDTRSQLRADYAPWAWLPMAPLDPRFLLEAAEGLGLPPIATAIGCLLPGNGCDTPTPTGTPATPTPGTGTPGAATSSPTVTNTPGVPTNTPTNEPPTYTPTVTNTPTQTPTPTPLVYPVKQASPSRIPPGAATVDFTIRVINYGSPAPAVLTRLTDTLPSEMTYRVGTCAPACTTGSGQTVEWLGSWSIPQGSFLTFRFTADVSGTVGGEVLTNWIEAVGTNFDLAVNNRRVTVLTPTPTATPVSIPVAGDDAFAGTEDTLLNIGAPGLLANDSDANGDPLSVQPAPVSGPSYGAVVLQPNGAFSYTPNADYYGADSFVYRVCDPSMLCDTATVTITLAGTPDDPVAVDDAYTFNEDGALLGLSPGVRLNDRDPDDLTAPLYDTLTVSLVSPPGHQDPANPFYLNADGSFGYWPTPHWYGEESFEYQACDPTSRCDNATVTLTVRSVNDPPAGADHSVTTDEDVTYVFQVSDFPFSDPNDAPPQALSAVVINTLPASGTLRLSGLPVAAGQVVPVASITAGNLTYLSPLNANGLPYTSFTFRVRDDGGTALGGVDTDPTPNVQTINVTPVNDAPLAVNDSWTLNPIYIVGQGGTMVVPPPPPAPAGVLSNDTDVDDAPATLSAAYLVGSGPAEHTGGPFVLRPDGSFDYEPDPVYHGPDSFQYTACDPAPLCSPVLATVSLLVDDPPVSQPDIFTLPEDTALPPSNVLADNGSGPDADPNGDVLSVQLISAPLHAAAFTLGADGSLAYTPAPNYSGPDSFQYRAFDGWLYGNIVSVGLTITAINDRPEANADSARTPVDTPVVIAVLANDTDVEGGPLRVAAIVTPPSSGGVVNHGASVTYTPNPGYIGNDSFVYQVCDPGADLIPGNGDDLCDQALVSVVVNGPPSGVDDAYSLAEDTTRVVAAPGVLANDTDPNGDTLTAVLISGPTHAAPLGFSFNANGSFSYRPAANYSGGDSFTYNVCDPDVCDPTPPTTVTLTITPVQDAPIAVDDGSNAIPLVAVEDTPLDILVLANDSDPDGDPLSIQSVANPPHGTAVIHNNGTPGDTTDDFVRYTPDWNYVGDDQFTYTISALGGIDTATIYVTVTPVNDPPDALDNWYRTSVNTLRSVAAPGVLGNDVDPEGDAPITASLLAAPGNGTLIPSVPCPTGLCSDGSFQYTPNLGFHGEDTFTYEACDPSLACDWATVTMSVNGPPTAEDDPEPPAVWSLAEDGSRLINAPDVLANDTDPDLDVLELDSVGAPANGSAVLDDNGTPGVPGDDTILYTPDPDYFGDDSFTYRVCDPFNGCDQATIAVRVLPVNDAPVAQDDPEPPTVYRANIGSNPQLAVAAPGVLGNDTDVDGDPLQAVLDAGPSQGGVALNPDGSFVYTPGPGARGIDTFTYVANDATVDSNLATVTILVNGIPDAIDDATYSTNEDVALAVDDAGGVLANDNEPDGDGMTATLVSGPAGLTLNADGSFAYTPPLDFNSPPVVTFDYEACDIPWGACDTATASITVHPVNDAPTAANDSNVTDVGVPVSIFVLSNDTDVDLGDIVYLDGLVTPPANGVALPNDNGTPADASDDYYDYQPNPGYISSPLADTFTYRITDGHGGLDTAFVSVTVNGPPVAGPPEAYATPEDTLLSVAAPGVLANDSDPNLDTISAVQVTGAGYGPFNGALTLNANGSFSYSPAANYFGADSFAYQACDPRGLCSAEITVDLTITPVNDPPVARDDGPYATAEDVPLDVDALSGLLGNDNDPIEGDPVTAAPASGTTTGGGSYAVAVDGSFSYVPAANFNGVDTFTYRAFDGTDPSAPATVTINVAPANDPPVARDDSATTNQGTPVLINVVGNDYDVDGPAEIVPGSAAVIGGPASGSLVNNGDGTFTYTPAVGQYSGDSFTYTVDDIFGATSNAATVTIGIRPAVLQILKEADPDTASLGDTIDFYIYVWNNGPGTAYGVSLSDTLGSCFAFIGGSPEGSLGDIAEGGAVVRTAQARVVADTACGDTNTAQVSAANASTVSDQVSVTLLPMGGGGAPAMALMGTELEPLPPSPEAESQATATVEPTATPEPPADPTATPEPPADPTATPLVVAQGSLMADTHNPLGWLVLALTGIWLGQELVFRLRLPHAAHPHKGTRDHEPATRPHRR